MTDKRKPAHKIRSGNITMTIWKNEGKVAWYTATPSRTYKQGDQFKESDSFAVDDLMNLAKLCDMAHSWIVAQQAERQAA
jgi:hypothetical protein